MNPGQRRPHLPALALLLPALLFGGEAAAERPMVVDDAGALTRGDGKVEFGWSRAGRTRGFDLAAGYVPVDDVEISLGLARTRDHAASPDESLRSTSLALKWVPLVLASGVSAGLAYSRQREHAARAPGNRGETLGLLLSWQLDGGALIHANLGRSHVHQAGPNLRRNTWGLGSELPLAETLTLTLETYGAEHQRPGRQAGIRYRLADGLKLSAALGRCDGERVASLGIVREF